MYETASKRVYKSKRCVLFMTFRPSQRTLFMARLNWVPLALNCSKLLHSIFILPSKYILRNKNQLNLVKVPKSSSLPLRQSDPDVILLFWRFSIKLF